MSAPVGVKVAVLPAQSTVPGTGVAPRAKVNVVAVQVAGFTASLKLATSLLLVPTPVAVSPGFVDLRVGAVVSPIGAGPPPV